MICTYIHTRGVRRKLYQVVDGLIDCPEATEASNPYPYLKRPSGVRPEEKDQGAGTLLFCHILYIHVYPLAGRDDGHVLDCSHGLQ